ncbi:MAG: hypothetical protein QXH24_04650 [Candidatus Bathyarchaeia archaeon]
MLLIKNLESKISYFERLLQNISRDILANVFYESALPSRLLADSENYLSALKNTAEEIKNALIILKPERAPSIKRAFREFIQLINVFTETLRNAEETQSSSKGSLEYLKEAVKQGRILINLARDIAKNPSKSIIEVLRLKEISDAKDYILRINMPEAVYARLEYFKKNLESFKEHVSSLEQIAKDLLKHIERIEEEISKLQQ